MTPTLDFFQITPSSPGEGIGFGCHKIYVRHSGETWEKNQGGSGKEEGISGPRTHTNAHTLSVRVSRGKYENGGGQGGRDK